jgi:hypothetical protein
LRENAIALNNNPVYYFVSTPFQLNCSMESQHGIVDRRRISRDEIACKDLEVAHGFERR